MIAIPTLQMRKRGKEGIGHLPRVIKLVRGWSKILSQMVWLQSSCSDQVFTLSRGRWPFHCWPAQMMRHEDGKLLKISSIICDVDLPHKNPDIKRRTLWNSKDLRISGLKQSQSIVTLHLFNTKTSNVYDFLKILLEYIK